MYKFPPKPLSPEEEEKLAKQREQAEINKMKQINEKIKESRREKLRKIQIHEPSPVDQFFQYKLPIQPQNPRSLTVAFLGAANAGKSSIVNRFVGTKVTAVSRKAQTTRENILGIATKDNIQMCFIDTPGIMNHKTLQREIEYAWDVVFESDITIVVQDCVKTMGTIENGIIQKLRSLKEKDPGQLPPLVYLLNKMDLYEKMKDNRYPILDRIKKLVPDAAQIFDEIFTISALTGKNFGELEKFLVSKAENREWAYAHDNKTDQSNVQLCHELIREKIFRRVNQELPYLVKIETVGWTSLKDGALRIDQKLIVPKRSHVNQLIGTNGQTILGIQQEAQLDLQVAFNRPVLLYFDFKVSKKAVQRESF